MTRPLSRFFGWGLGTRLLVNIVTSSHYELAVAMDPAKAKLLKSLAGLQ